MAFQPLNDLVLVRRVEIENTTHKGTNIAIPEKFRQASNFGTVIAVSRNITQDIKVGDRVMFGVYNAEDIEIDGELLQLIRENDIRGLETAGIVL